MTRNKRMTAPLPRRHWHRCVWRCLLGMTVSVLSFVMPLAASAAKASLADAAEKLERSTISRLMQQHAGATAAQADGMTALHWTVWHDEIELAELLIGAGADVQATNRYGV